MISDAQKIRYADFLIDSFAITSCASMSKTELEFLVFEASLISEIISMADSDFEIGMKLRITSSRASALRYKHRLANQLSSNHLVEMLEQIVFLDIDPESGLLKISIEDAFFRDMFTSELRKMGTAVDGSFSKAVIQVKADIARSCFVAMSGKESQELVSKIDRTIAKHNSDNFSQAVGEFIASVTSGTLAGFLSNWK